MTPAQLLALAANIAKQADKASAKFERALSQVIKQTERRLVTVITTASQGASDAIIKGHNATRTKAEIREALKKGGFDALVEAATSAVFDQIATTVLMLRSETNTLASSGAMSARVAALRALAAQDLLNLGDQLALALWRATARGIFAESSTKQILADLAQIIDDTEAHIRTFYDTSVSIFGRQVEALQAGNDPDTLFVYLGPDDDKTRPFCHAHVGKVYDRAEIDKMDNGQLDNVFLTGGGYNCRHSWIELAKSSGLVDLHGTGARMPEVAARMAA